MANNDLSIRQESVDKTMSFGVPEKLDWEANLVQEMIAIRSNLEPLRQQIS